MSSHASIHQSSFLSSRVSSGFLLTFHPPSIYQHPYSSLGQGRLQARGQLKLIVGLGKKKRKEKNRFSENFEPKRSIGALLIVLPLILKRCRFWKFGGNRWRILKIVSYLINIDIFIVIAYY